MASPMPISSGIPFQVKNQFKLLFPRLHNPVVVLWQHRCNSRPFTLGQFLLACQITVEVCQRPNGTVFRETVRKWSIRPLEHLS